MNRKWILIATAAGLLGTTAGAGAAGIVQKVSGVLRGDVTVTVDGEATNMKPVFIRGQAYLPARDEANALGYEASYSGKDKRLTLNKKEEAPDYARLSGVIQNVEAAGDGGYRIDVLGKGDARRMILTVDKDTVLRDSAGQTFAASDLKAGMLLTAEYGPIVAMSYPGQSHAASVTVGVQTLIREDVVQSVEQTADGWQVKIGSEANGASGPAAATLVLNGGKETTLLDSEGQPVKWEDLGPGTKIRAYYGPVMYFSLPPQSPLHVLVKLADDAASLSPAEAQQYRELAWSLIPQDQKKHLTTKRDEAEVALAPAKDAAVWTVSDDAKQTLQALQEKGGRLVTVTYRTDQDALLGPLTAAFDPETKELLGYFQRY